MSDSCTVCIHKFVCTYHASILAVVEDNMRFLVGGKPMKLSLVNTEIRHIIAENCQYFKSFMEDTNGTKKAIDTPEQDKERTSDAVASQQGEGKGT